MNKYILLIFCAWSTFILGQSYAPGAGEPGSTAIPHDDSRIVAWATNIQVQRGFIDIGDTSVYYSGSNKATFGSPSDAVGPATNLTTDVVSLGDSGIAIATFGASILNGPGPDFVIFENGLSNTFLELAHVEVSSDGVNYYRFPSHSETQTNTPIGGFGMLEPSFLYNLAGKYRVGFGTPFDLEELKDSAGLNVNQVTHVKIIDAVGTLGAKGTTDSYGNKINDPYPTPFNSGGFDLNGVGVINQGSLGTFENELNIHVYPNPSNGLIHLATGSNQNIEINFINNLGQNIEPEVISQSNESLSFFLKKGVYFMHVKNSDRSQIKKIIIQ